jgi:tetratricopeptide (TPR) repeat protein/predicted Ser/Thr protein kinase
MSSSSDTPQNGSGGQRARDLVGRTIAHYTVIEQIGEGGMGLVCKAEDLNLKRTVAIKFLPRHIAADSEERERFKIEAQAAAALNHANIATIHSIEEAEDELFIVMEYIEGKTLSEVLGGGQLPIDKAIKYAVQAAEGLEAAHEKGVVHRDIKSANIMVTDKGQVKIMDFGLAKVRGGKRVTTVGSTLGTAGYMSPEQARGEEVDQRTDIWSFGVVLYEMLAGQLPFTSDYDQALVYQILNEEPKQLRELRSDIPIGVEEVIARCLSKAPDQRYQKTGEIVEALSPLRLQTAETAPLPQAKRETKGRKTIAMVGAAIAVVVVGLLAYTALFSTGGEAGERIPLAVLDVVNETGEAELDGLSGMLTTSLEQSRRLAVVTRSRMFDILRQMGKDSVTRIDESIGREICIRAGVNAMVSASIRKFGQLYTVDLKVLEPTKSEYIFTAKEEGTGQESIPAMLDRLSEKTRIGLKERAAEVRAQREEIASLTTSNLEAYQHYFQGEELINRLEFDKAEEEFRKAIALDSTFGLAYYRLGYSMQWNQEVLAGEPLQKAMQYIDKIPEKERYMVRANQTQAQSGFAAALPILREMEEIYPDDKEMQFEIGDMSYHSGDLATAEEYFKKVLAVDPAFQRALQHITWLYRDLHQYDRMLQSAKDYVARAGTEESYDLLSEAYGALGSFDEGREALLGARQLFPENYRLTREIANLYMYEGRVEEAEAELQPLVDPSQPASTRRSGYGGLFSVSMYEGKVRKALEYQDEIIRLSLEEGDSSDAARAYLFTGFIRLWAWEDPVGAKREIAAGIALARTLAQPDITFSFNLTMVNAAVGEFEKADSLKRLLRPDIGPFVEMVEMSTRGECADAKSIADSILTNVPPDVKIFLTQMVVQCQIEGGMADEALLSLRQIDSLRIPRDFFWVKSQYHKGRAHEEKGEVKRALQNYERALEVWHEADDDLPILIDTKKRVARLKQAS